MPYSPIDFVVDRKLFQSWTVNPALSRLHLQDEATVVQSLVNKLDRYQQQADDISQTAYKLVASIREQNVQTSALDAFMHEYDLSSEEGVLLMCIAEALLRIPDEQTAEKLQKTLQPGDVLLAKGSRVMRMERVVQLLAESPSARVA